MRKPDYFKTQRLFAVVLAAVSLTLAVVHNEVLALSSAIGLTEPAELEAFMDGVFETQLKSLHIAGATFAVVKDNALFLAKGYGCADIENRKPVRADTTLFRIASISKLFVWTAVMQLVEQGKIDLDVDINTYLTRFKIPDTYPEPITLNHLMTHTAGFEDNVIGLFAKNKERLLPLETILARDLPARVRPPGQMASYSNHGTGIAALIVEKVSGMSWNDYVEKNILKPLKMENTTFRQPVPDPLSANLAKGYSYTDGEFHKEPFVYVPMAPVASASTSATDMAKFMLAHLNQGQLKNSRILNTETARQMHSALFRNAPEVNPMDHGFLEISRNGRRVIGHDGNILYFHSLVALLPEERAGLFVSYNSREAQRATEMTYNLFMDRYYPPENKPVLYQVRHSRKQLRRFTGSYFSNRRDHDRLAKLGALFKIVKVTLAEDGVLKTINSEATRWIEIKPLTFREEYGLKTLVFREDEHGRITHMFIGNRPTVAYERIRTQDLPQLHAFLFGVASLLFLTALVSWPVGALIRWRYNLKIVPQRRISPYAYFTAWNASLLFIVFAILLAVVLGDPNEISFGITKGIKVMMMLSIVCTILTAATLIFTIIIWKQKRGRVWGRIYYTAVTVALFSTLWQLNHWNLVGFQY